MTLISHKTLDVPPSFSAGLILAALPLLAEHDLPCPSAKAVVEVLGVSRSRAYEVKAAIMNALPALVRPPGRPPTSPPPSSSSETEAITQEVGRYVMDHPGCVHGGPQRHRYSDGFRHFVLDKCALHNQLDLPSFADAALIPLGTLKDWLRGGCGAVEKPKGNLSIPQNKAKGPQIESILAAYKIWQGSFKAFCDHVQLQLRIPWGRTTISEVLNVHNLRRQKSRGGRRPDEKALRGQFETFFAGAMWSADGSPLSVTIDGETFTFNLELNVDTHTNALVGMSLLDEENGAAVVEAFDDGVTTTGAAPISQLLDNRHSNHTDEVVEALDDTIKIRRTQGRPQNGAHVEGAFGLFQQMAPCVILDTSDERELARQALLLVILTWARTLNHRPQDAHDGRSRFRRYTEASPTPEEIEAATKALRERQRKQEKARLTKEARLDPVKQQLLSEIFERLDLPDPEGNIKKAIAGFSMDSIIAGIAIFEVKIKRDTLPEGADGRYLLGIVRNLDQEDEGILFAEKLWQARQAAGDLVLIRLDEQREEQEGEVLDSMDLIRRFVDLAMSTDRSLDRSFWLRAVSDTIEGEPAEEHHAMFLVAARRIHTTHRVPKAQRNAATRRLAVMVRPIT